MDWSSFLRQNGVPWPGGGAQTGQKQQRVPLKLISMVLPYPLELADEPKDNAGHLTRKMLSPAVTETQMLGAFHGLVAC